MEYEVVIGLEVHVQLQTETKIFCPCSTTFGALPNTHSCPVCVGMPGVLPVLNRKVVEFAMKMALATHCKIAPFSVFARKHYFYPDLPKGYQISQYDLPLAERGWIEIAINGQIKRIGITRIHLEEDAGKLIHDENRPVSYVDLNRTGVPLIEIVSEPDIRSPEEAALYLKKVRQQVRYLEISDGNMEEGSLRCDANISLRPRGREDFGVRTELKNMNSFRNVQKALEFEIRRQTALLLDGHGIVQETRLWDTAKSVTVAMRGKEEAHDYRYFPDPDLVPVEIDNAWMDSVKEELPELPDAKCARFEEQYGLSDYDAGILTASKSLADYFEECVALFPSPKIVSNWIMVELFRLLKRENREIDACPIPPAGLAELLKLIDNGTISGKMAKDILEQAYDSKKSPKKIVEEQGVAQVSDESTISTLVKQVVDAHPKEIEKCKAGKTKILGFLVGQVMKKTKGQANPQKVNELLRKAMGL
ncbi:MAG: Asp-tRNA(Asn)/Glu-tRNA(Gln) amidotransferase subunit GatB [Deltaproteobacteria bacterium]|nr:Asp-tRNA(Asn)/Glu-tRNA(Gln) amidotransferase subunit GatB [Deltaproteobacteria bacterium]MBW1931574.1 Asp-tRNA(Asn)/Glu-tRNA(Gln) amidotransferase subunit GatB [Deltaproteobacteria bacterium]MBW1937437.1 Asp-tRNA(Asn)/Glu-tRNA(Gln) amidotransferase subunit GatB [Deltaproteobacteria bacterium]MBW1964957.1 Asp-tRNA(Asn)/Glu-tRNA(Gln) amidotransferase subunit GatB [Deltaproteobacteria bacterium]MBW2080420.1 Asp-tRNA(Asn)/Glu-tRNA(Gln) amidotransferase subunit GatB [Deltaproteobacteria bacterium